MIVRTPQTKYEVTIPPMDTELLDNCESILEEILETMDNYNCDILSYGYTDDIGCIKWEDIKNAKNLLSTLKEVHTME